MSTYMAQWWHIVHEAVAEADRRCDGEVPWRDSYADVFPDPEALRRALACYWRLEVAGQVEEWRRIRVIDEYMPGSSDTLRRRRLAQLATEHRGLLLALSDDDLPAAAPVSAPGADRPARLRCLRPGISPTG